MTAITSARNEMLVEETSFRGAVSEALMQKIGASINYLIEMGAVGDVVCSALTEAQFQAQRSANWVLCDGSSCVGTSYETITGETTVPDLRGEFVRGADNGRGVDVARALLSTQSGTSLSHNHQWSNLSGTTDNLGSAGQNGSYQSDGTTVLTTPLQGAASAYTNNSLSTTAVPRNVALNYFIRVD